MNVTKVEYIIHRGNSKGMRIMYEIGGMNGEFGWSKYFSNVNSFVYRRIQNAIIELIPGKVLNIDSNTDLITPLIRLTTNDCLDAETIALIEKKISLTVSEILEQEDVEVDMSEIYEFVTASMNGEYEKIKKAIGMLHDNLYGFVGIKVEDNKLKAKALAGLNEAYIGEKPEDVIVRLAKEKLASL